MSDTIPTLTEEIERFGEVRDGGCLLRIERGEYVMEECRNIFNRHRLDIASTSEDRLEAHWAGFVKTNRLVSVKKTLTERKPPVRLMTIKPIAKTMQNDINTIQMNTRRRLLLGMGAGLAMLPLRARADFFGALTGGFNAGMEGAGSTEFKNKLAAQNRRLATPEVEAGSREAEAYFRTNLLTMDHDRFSAAARKASLREFQLAMNGAKRAGLPRHLNFLQMADLGEILAPSLLRLDETWLYDEKLADGMVFVPARSAVKANYAGYCLDKALPAPAGGARLRLLPLSSVTDEKTAKAIQVLAHAAARHARQLSVFGRTRDSEEMQSLVWALRDMQLGVTPKLNSTQRRMLAAVDPEQFGKPDALDDFGWRLGEAFGKDVRRNFGRMIDLSDMNSVKGRMDEIAHGAKANEAPTGSPFTQLAPGVGAMSINGLPLQGDVVIANDRPEPVSVNLRSYVAEAATDSQRILISDVSNGLGRFSTIDKDVMAAVEKDLAQLSLFAGLDWFPQGIGRIGFSPKSAYLARLVNYTPILGNVLSAYEAWNGYEWTERFKDESERKPMGAGERILAIAGIVPGAGALAKVIGKNGLGDLILKAGSVSGKFDSARNLGEWAVSDTVWASIAKVNGASPGEAEAAMKESIEQMSPLASRAIKALERV